MVTAVAFIAVLEHHFGTVDPGEYVIGPVIQSVGTRMLYTN